MFLHKEFEFRVLAPYDIKQCQYHACKNQGEWMVIAKDDHDAIMFQYKNVCEQHILQTFIEAGCTLEDSYV